MAASYPQRGGGVSSKIVKLGDTYGDLPVPTRTGYSFVGWRGRNLINIYKGYPYNSNVSYTINEDNSVDITNMAHTSDGTNRYDCAIIPLEDLTNGKYWLAVEGLTYIGECREPVIDVSMVVQDTNKVSGIYLNYSKESSGYFDVTNADKATSGSFWLEIYISSSHIGNNFPSFEKGELHFKNITLSKVSSENEVVRYEPYYIESGTVFGTPGDRTLVAKWSANSNNLFTNGDFEDVYTQTDTGWDNNINGTLHATGWLDYNEYISNASTAMHAHLKDISATDSQHKHVFEMIGAHESYIGACQNFNSTTKFTKGVYRVSASVKGISGQNIFTMGLYYSQSGSNYESSNFYSGQYAVRFQTTDWIRVSWTFSITKITYADAFYFYGDKTHSNTSLDVSDITPSMNNIFYLDDVFLTQIA